MLHSKVPFLLLAIWLPSTLSCSTESASPPSSNKAPGRCSFTDIGESADFIVQSQIVDDRLVIAYGLANPHALVWRDQTTGKSFYITKVMGTGQKLFYHKEIQPSEQQGIASEFKGHLLRWDKLPKERSLPITNALSRQYQISVNPESTYIILAGEKPVGCP
jgi:hypothetical protein